jgi:bifunctional non-homologous end joining protein LigD
MFRRFPDSRSARRHSHCPTAEAGARHPPPSDFVSPCIPTAGPEWVHEIKHDGYRLQVRREGSLVRLFTRRGFDWSDRYPAIGAAAAKLAAESFTLDGEAFVCGPDGVAIFDAIHRHPE